MVIRFVSAAPRGAPRGPSNTGCDWWGRLICLEKSVSQTDAIVVVALPCCAVCRQKQIRLRESSSGRTMQVVLNEHLNKCEPDRASTLCDNRVSQA